MKFKSKIMSKFNFKIKLTIRSQITIVFAVILLLSFSLNFIINNIFLGDYYYVEKESLLKNIYSQLNNYGYTDQEYDELYQLCLSNNINIIIVSKNFESTVYIDRDESHFTSKEAMTEKLQSYINGYSQTDSIESNTFYFTQRTFDDKLKIPYLELIAQLDSDHYLLMRTAVSNIENSVNIINNFSYFSYIFCICVGIVGINSLSNLITFPIEKLCNISQKMTAFDFSEMFKYSMTEEVNILGQNLNNLSTTLDDSMKQLKATNERLEVEIAQKAQTDDMRKEFISNVSHELKTPIAVIQGYAEGLKECDNDEDRDFYCEVIVEEAIKMDKMVKQLIELNKLEFGQDEDAMVFLNLKQFIQNIAKNLKLLLNDIDFEIIGDNDCFVIFDEIKLEQIVTNYLTNAIHYVDENKKIRVVISTGEKIKLSVFNSGNHISENDKHKIWDKFYKIDKARTRTYGGSGIGLSIVSAIMRKYGEDFGFENVENGVEFYIYLKKA